jgi:Tfp pilus assembly protein PilV
MTLAEVLIALLLLSVGLFGLLSLQSSSWNLAGKSDALGRAAGILQKHLHTAEAAIMNPAANSTPGVEILEPVYAGGQSTPQPGDAAFRVETTISGLGGGMSRATVKVTWPGNPDGISESLIAGRQEGFRQ